MDRSTLTPLMEELRELLSDVVMGEIEKLTTQTVASEYRDMVIEGLQDRIVASVIDTVKDCIWTEVQGLATRATDAYEGKLEHLKHRIAALEKEQREQREMLITGGFEIENIVATLENAGLHPIPTEESNESP